VRVVVALGSRLIEVALIEVALIEAAMMPGPCVGLSQAS
jgi:hypothetical protein